MVNYPLAIYFSSCFEINHFTCKLFNMKNSVQVRDYYILTLCLCTISSQIVLNQKGWNVHARNRIPDLLTY